MTKILLNNNQDFEALLIELNDENGVDLSFETESQPTSFPCILMHHYSIDVDFGSLYNIEFVYPKDFFMNP